MFKLRFTALVAVPSVVGFGSPAIAQSDTVVVSESTLQILTESQTASRFAQLERAYDRVNLTRPRTMIGVSTVLLAGGAGMIAAGESFFRHGFGSFANGGDAATSNGLTTLGSLMIVGSTIGLVIASRRLKKKKAERRRLQQQLANFELPRQAP